MEKTYKESTDMWALDTDAAHIIHRIGSDDYTPIRHTTVKAADLDRWEELAVEDIPPYTKAEYDAKVAELIHARYDADRETSLINNMLEDSPTEAHKAEYREYQLFRARCKADAPAAIAADKARRDAEEAARRQAEAEV